MKKLKITETSLRDGHQSLIATRLKTNEIIPILETMDQVGYYAMEVWGGATFDACIRFLNEDPWERLRLIRKHVKNTKLQMLLRGQNLLGYRNYADDTVEKFIELSIKNGIDIIRVFDALNDVRNLEASIKAIKKYNGHCQCAISYTTSPIHTPEYYLELIKTMESMGADSICIKDMAGFLKPHAAYSLIKKLKEKESDLIKVLKSFLDDQAIRIMTIHKSKGLEFHSVIMLAVENETFWGKNKDAERCAFFVGVSRAKQRLLITYSKERQKPEDVEEWKWKARRNKHTEYWGYFI